MRKALFTLLLLLCALPLTAHADTTDLFTITGDSHVYTFAFTPEVTFPNQLHLVTIPSMTTTGTIDGVGSQTFDVSFYTNIGTTGESLEFNGILLAGPSLISFVGQSGTPGHLLDTAEFDIGSYRLIDLANSSLQGPDYYYLTIAPETIPSSTPEPSTILLLATGVLGISNAVRRRALP